MIIPANGNYNDDSVPVSLLPLGGKPLICHAIDTARQLAENIEICISSSDINVIKTVNNYGLRVPFKLPQELYTNMFDVDEIILHAIDHYARKELNFDTLVLLSPYSPFCQSNHILDAAVFLEADIEMVAGVKVLTQATGQYYLTENQEGYLQKHTDVPESNGEKVYNYNNAFAILKTSAIRQYPRSFFRRISKYVMDNTASIFVENMDDLMRCEQILRGD